MPTYSSTANFDLSIDDIAEEAFERCGLQIRSGYDIKTARRSLNLMLAEWANRGLNLWTIQKQEKTLKDVEHVKNELNKDYFSNSNKETSTYLSNEH